MRTIWFTAKSGFDYTAKIPYEKPAGTVVARLTATNVNGSTQVISGAAAVASDSITLVIPSTYNVSNNYPAKFLLEVQVDGGSWVSFLEAKGTLTPPPAADPLASKENVTNAAGLPLYTYGNSFGILTAGWFTSGKHYTDVVKASLGTGSVTAYAISGTRIADVSSHLIGGAIGGVTGQAAGAPWPGTSNRKGIVVLESVVNDAGHYANHSGTAIPVAITTANTQYLDGLTSMYRAALACLCGETRVENTTATFTGSWTTTATPYSSAGSVSFTNGIGNKATFTVTPPQSGPFAGKVYLVTYKLAAAAGVNATVTPSVDGVNLTNKTWTAWEAYTGQTGANVTVIPDVIPFDLPIDGASHTVAVAHSGGIGQWVYVDCVIIPSTDPNPVFLMGAETPVKTGVWNASQVAIYCGNLAKVTPLVKSVAAEFPNVIYVPSTMSQNGYYSVDGIHPNDRGMEQRANDLLQSAKNLGAKFKNYVLNVRSDSTFTKI